MARVSYRPGRPTAALALVATTATLPALLAAQVTTAAWGVGVVLLAVGVRNDAGAVITAGAVVLFLGLLAASAWGASLAAAVAAAAGVAAAWDLAAHALSLRRELDAAADARRAELARGVASVGALGGAAAGSYAVAFAAPARQHAAAVVALVLAGAVLAAAVRT